MVHLILNLFKSILNEDSFKPTPIKFYYFFNIKDISRVISGISLIDKFNCDSHKALLNLVIHETQRVF